MDYTLIYIVILILHWVADFLLQTRKMAINKSTDPNWLTAHVLVYSSVFFAASFIYYQQLNLAMLFFSITYIAHFFTDFITSKISSYFYKKKNMHAFFSTIGFDQTLHFIQLFLTYEFVTKQTLPL